MLDVVGEQSTRLPADDVTFCDSSPLAQGAVAIRTHDAPKNLGLGTGTICTGGDLSTAVVIY